MMELKYLNDVVGVPAWLLKYIIIVISRTTEINHARTLWWYLRAGSCVRVVVCKAWGGEVGCGQGFRYGC